MTILDFFLNRQILIKTRDYSIPGKLVFIDESRKQMHRPLVLILQTPYGRALFRGDWNLIAEVKA